MEFSIDISWITLLLGITGCLIGYFAFSPNLYGPSCRVMILKGFFLNEIMQNKQLSSSSNRSLGNIRRRKSSFKSKLNPVSLSEEAPLNPLFPNQSTTKTREEFQCIHGFIQSLLSCSHYSPSFSS